MIALIAGGLGMKLDTRTILFGIYLVVIALIGISSLVDTRGHRKER
jgi:hypothetical protein